MKQDFTNAQKEAITHGIGPMMVLAGPGSGKTLVLTHRILNLIQQQGVSPSNILVVTFTKAAAMQMQRRFEKMTVGIEVSGKVSFGTFHAIFYKILRFAYRNQLGRIITEEQKYTALREMIRRKKLDIDDEKELIASLLGEISIVKGEMMDLEHYYSNSCPSDVFRQLYAEYEQFLKQERLLDFDDMQVMCYQLLKERPDILAAWQNKYQYILVDEFQDICKLQYELLRLLAAPQNNLFIVGDDDQSIYRFRGAKPEIMLNFEKDYPDTKRVLLDVNYRCDSHIVEAAGRLIHWNQTRFDKQIVAARKAIYPVEICNFVTAKAENEHIAKQIRLQFQKGIPYTDVAVLFRTNRCAGQFVQKLMEYNIPFQMRDVLPNLYEHWISRNILDYIHFALGDRNRGRFLQIMNRPNRYIRRAAVQDTEVNFEDLYTYYQDERWMIERIEHMELDLRILTQMKPEAGVAYIRKGIGYEEYLAEYAYFRQMKPDELYEILDELQEAAKEFTSYEAWFEHIENYTKELSMQSRQQKEQADGVMLMTMHSAKGLEFPTVYILDANEGITPHDKAVLDVDIEEERRLFYVAMTRAKNHLYICSSSEKYSKTQTPSRFIAECQKEKR
jgi:DNA helicase-2/ATP-dependent DNA helicase PcrA